VAACQTGNGPLGEGTGNNGIAYHAAVEGRVLGPAGRPVPEAMVRLSPHRRATSDSAVPGFTVPVVETDPTGAFRIVLGRTGFFRDAAPPEPDTVSARLLVAKDSVPEDTTAVLLRFGPIAGDAPAVRAEIVVGQ
jgi:hypothetical protein